MDYKLSFILFYFDSYGKNYKLQDIIEKLGIAYVELNKYISELILLEFIKYEDDCLIGVTDKGRDCIDKSTSNIFELSKKKQLLKINTEKALKRDEPYFTNRIYKKTIIA